MIGIHLERDFAVWASLTTEGVMMIGLGKRISYALRSFFVILARGEIPEELSREIAKVSAPVAPTSVPAPISDPATQAPPPDSADGAVQILALLQRDGRLIDFLTEDIASYSDGQVGAAVRTVHASCRQVLERYVRLEPIIASDEGQSVTVQEDVDPATTKLIGNVTGKPPLHGVLRHRGWHVTQVHLPPVPTGVGRSVVAPAEVEVP